MKHGAILLIAAMLAAPITAILSTSTVQAAHTPTVEIDPEKVRGGFIGVFTLTVSNVGDAINQVRLYSIPTGWTGFAPVAVIPEDNLVRLAGADNEVILPAGTVVQLSLFPEDNIILAENTDVLIPEDNQFRFGGTLYTLGENLEVEVTAETKITGITDLENVEIAAEAGVVFPLDDDNRVRLLQDTPVVRVGDNIVRLPENTLVQLVVGNDDNIAENVEVSFRDYYLVTLPTTAENVRSLEADIEAAPSLAGIDMMGDILDLEQLLVYIPPGTPVKIEGTPLALVLENENVLETKDNLLDTGIADVVENSPLNWAQDATNRIWSAIGNGENAIGDGESENFPFAITAPTAAGTYTFYLRTTDVTGAVEERAFIVEVDNALVVEVDVDRTWVGPSENITITVRSNPAEPFTFENVLVEENNAPENVPVTMTPNADNTVWTGVYTTENADFDNQDGYLTIYVVNAVDEVGNLTSVTEDDLVFIDRYPPPAPSLTGIGIPVGVENETTFSISVSLTAADDNLVWTPAGYLPENLRLQVLVDDVVVAEEVSTATGLISFDLTLSEGLQEISARIVDKAGNEGEENVDNVIVDTIEPSISISIDPPLVEGYLVENMFTVTVTLSDATLGIENIDIPAGGLYNGNENLYDNAEWDNGFYIFLADEDGNEIVGLTVEPPVEENVENAVPNVFLSWTFENYFDNAGNGLATGTWMIKVIAGDSMFSNYGLGKHRVEENIVFTLDIVPPAAPTIEVTYEDYIPEDPLKTDDMAWTLRGDPGSTEGGATIKIYGTFYKVENGVTDITPVWTDNLLASFIAEADGSWRGVIYLDDYEGMVVEIEVSATDAAGNEGTRSLYGCLMYDATPPRVEIYTEPVGPEDNFTEESIVIKGKVHIQPWERYADIDAWIEGIPLDIDDITGEFSDSVELVVGTNDIDVRARDLFGNDATEDVLITRVEMPVEPVVPVVEIPPEPPEQIQVVVERPAVPDYAPYAIVIVIIALILAAIAIFRKK